MVRKLRLAGVLVAVVLGTFLSGAFFTVSARKERSKEEIQAEIQRLERKKQEDAAKRQQAEASRPSDRELNQIIDRYEKLLEQCAVRKNDQCADVMYTLGALYYDQSKGNDDYVKAVKRYPDELKAYERTGRGTPPKYPVPDYSKSLRMYWQLTREYPKFEKLPEALFQMSGIYMVAGHLDTTKIVLEQLVDRFPKSRRVSAAHFRLGDLAFADGNYTKAEKHLKKVKKKEVDLKTWETTQDLLAKIAQER